MGQSVLLTVLLVVATAGNALAAEPKPVPPPELCRGSFIVTGTTAIIAGCLDANCTYAFSDPTFLNDGTQIGTSDGVCTVFSADDNGGSINYCSINIVTTAFGSLTAQGTYTDLPDARFELAITGGTGIWRYASGIVQVFVKKAGEAWKYTVRLNKPGKC